VALETIKILLVEDDPDDVLLLRELIAGGRHEIEAAGTLKAALTAISAKRWDIVLADLTLPDSRGIETFLRLRAQRSDVPIVVLTGLNDQALSLEAVRLGAQDYLMKGSLDGRLVKRSIAYAIERHHLIARLEAIIEKSADGMVVVDRAGFVRYMNPAAETLFGREAEAMLGKAFPFELEPGSAREVTLAGGEEPRTAEIRVTEMEWKKEPARLASIRDVTQLKRFQQLKAEMAERRRLDDLKNQFMGAVSHEMRTPLTIVHAAVDNLIEGLLGPLAKKQQEVLALAQRNLRRLTRIVNDLLDLSRLESGHAKIERKSVRADRLVHEVVQNLSVAEDGRKVDIRLQLGAGLPAIYADPDLFVQVLLNLLDNARRYAKSKIEVRASLEAAGREVVFAVQDDGPGIAQEDVGRLFTKFVQLNRPAGGGGYKGTGLGLAICKEIVDRHGGRIWVETASGKGASFFFALPTSEPVANKTPRRSHARR
jgi:signal transduction histidine kinase/ActR/RegA family two-component response regulator